MSQKHTTAGCIVINTQYIIYVHCAINTTGDDGQTDWPLGSNKETGSLVMWDSEKWKISAIICKDKALVKINYLTTKESNKEIGSLVMWDTGKWNISTIACKGKTLVN